MQELLRRVIKKYTKQHKENFRPGDTIEVHVKVVEGEKERVQIFRGTVIKLQGAGVTRTFTVRKMSNGVGVERTFPFTSPAVEKIDVITHGKVRRGKLYYLRDLKGRKARIQFELAKPEENVTAPAETAAAAPAETPKN